jgi:hypothetical protein
MAKGSRSRTMVPDELVPAAVRLLMRYGPTAVMAAHWRDPDDVSPNAARNPKEVGGYRAYDPLRWSRRRHGDASSITDLHIHAADRLRLAADMARLGALPGAVWAGAATPTPADRYSPSTGLPGPARAMLRADREYRRAMSILIPSEQEIIVAVVLENVSIAAWTRWRRYLGDQTLPQTETYKLVGALDKLVAHYDTEIKEDMAMGRVEL